MSRAQPSAGLLDPGHDPIAAVEHFQLFVARSRHLYPQRGVLPQTALYLIQRIATALHRRAEVAAAEHALHVSDLYILVLLQRAEPDHTAPLAMLQKALAFTSGGMTRRLDRLTQQGLIERITDPVDRRALQVRLTPAGVRKAAEVREGSVHREAPDPSATLSEAEWTELINQLQRILVSVE